MPFQVEFVSPEAVLYSGEGTQVVARTRGGGDIAFLAGHEPFIGSLQPSEVRVTEASRMLNLGDYLTRLPSELSGGQRQRVAIGRAIVREPKIFLFDEPLSNLDAKLRVQMRTEIKKLHQNVGKTTAYVTHDQIEAMTLASRIAVMHKGVLQQYDTPKAVYERPVNRFVAGFMGSPSMNFLRCEVTKQEKDYAVQIESQGTIFQLPVDPKQADLSSYVGKTVVLVLHDINFASCYSDLIIAMRDGHLVRQGTPAEIVTTANIHEIFDLEARVETVDGRSIVHFYL